MQGDWLKEAFEGNSPANFRWLPAIRPMASGADPPSSNQKDEGGNMGSRLLAALPLATPEEEASAPVNPSFPGITMKMNSV